MGASLAGGPSSGGGGRRRRRRRAASGAMSEINVTPFVDVMLVLLIIFMVSAPLLSNGVPVTLPESSADALPSEGAEPIPVVIDADGRIYYDNAETPLTELADSMRADGVDPESQRIYVRGDRGVPYGVVAEVIGALSASGFRNLGFVTLNES